MTTPAVAAAGLILAAGCGDSTGTGDARLTVEITDAPHPFLETATVTIGSVEIIPAGTGGPILLTDAGGTFDLLQLQDGVTAQLASLPIAEGQYAQLRLVVEAASVTLTTGFQFTDGTTTRDLVVPSGAQTGVKINLSDDRADSDGGLRIAGGETILVVDFDVQQNFTLQGNLDTPAGLQGILFTPLLRAVVRDIAGSISGRVDDNTGSAIAGATVRGTLQESGTLESLQTAVVTAITDDTGAYAIRFVAPGTYLVSVETTAGNASSQTVVVGEAENLANVEFVVTP